MPPGVFFSGSITVADAGFAAAQEVLRNESREFARDARQDWERSWRTRHGGSWLRWFLFHLGKDPPGTLAKLILLVLAVAIFALLPVWYVLRGAA